MAELTVLVRYRGRVQGVGFRATVRGVAAGFAVRGWVQNEMDGSVSMIASGEAAVVEAFLEAVRRSRLGDLIDQETRESSPRPAGEGFNVRA